MKDVRRKVRMRMMNERREMRTRIRTHQLRTDSDQIQTNPLSLLTSILHIIEL